MKRFVVPLAVNLCLLLAVSHYSTVVAKDTWVSVRTKNFSLIGNASEKDIRKVGLRLEQFREVFTRLFPKMRFNTPVPTTVVVFKSDSSYAPFKPTSNTAGYFQPGPDVNYITLTTEVRGQQDAFSVIFHEYTHLLVENTFPSVPVWFNEGLAEYYSTFRITDDQKIRLGTPIGSHVFLLRESKMLPLRTLFEVDHKSPHYNEKNKAGIFYAQSWALMHYLIIGKAGKVEQLGKFMETLNAKTPLEQAFQQAFGMPMEVMEKELREYVRKDRYNVLDGHFEHKLELDTTNQATPLTEAEAFGYLGDLLLHSRRKDAYTYLEKALKLDPNLGMAHASLGMMYFYEGKVKEAHASLERAVAANSQNYLAHYYYAFTLVRNADGGAVHGFPPEVATRIREHLQKAIALRPDYPEPYNLLAFVSVITGQGIDEAIASMKRVLSISPGRHDFINMLAQLYLRKQDFKAARGLLEQVVKSNASEEEREQAEQLLTGIITYETAMAEMEEAKKRGADVRSELVIANTGTGSTQSAPQQLPDPSSYLREVLRVPKAGETQLQATLVKIECGSKGIVFVVRSGTQLLRLVTKTFNDIEMTTYDPKSGGEITCGPRKPESAVVVCYVPNTNVLKSVEFVPADFKLK
ncbi:MAG TPA: tetratricopeptide repeat protein [Pyrinomonadaceae bacterium]|nr:tetratricopeptide repeat protein [Pyrinomonadaceae bacterium]